MSAPISARYDGSNYLYSIAPDVCWTPMGSTMVPVPYNSIAFLDTSERTSRSVRNNSEHDYQLNSRPSLTLGHEPGTGKGVVVPGYMKYSLIMQAEETIFSEGWAIVRDAHPAWINRPDPGGDEVRRSKSKENISIP